MIDSLWRLTVWNASYRQEDIQTVFERSSPNRFDVGWTLLVKGSNNNTIGDFIRSGQNSSIAHFFYIWNTIIIRWLQWDECNAHKAKASSRGLDGDTNWFNQTECSKHVSFCIYFLQLKHGRYWMCSQKTLVKLLTKE